MQQTDKIKMMNRIFVTLLSFLLLTASVFAQDSTQKRKIAIFSPLYLDSAFDANRDYRYSKNEFPKYLNPGLEFYEGAQLALDSLSKEYAPLEVFIYDTKSTAVNLDQQLNKALKDSVEVIIAYCSADEIRAFANAGLRNNIPVINVNLPNDGGVTSNPFFVVLNPTLKAQCEGMYKYVQQYYATMPIVVFRKKGQLEDRIKQYFDGVGRNSNGSMLRLKYVDLPANFTESQLKSHLDTTQQTLCIAGSLDESFGKHLCQHLAALKKQNYNSVVLGMPTWDNINDLNKPEYKGLEIIYSKPFYNPRTDKVSQGILNHFNTVMYSRPSDMVFRGYEVTFRYSRLLLKYGKDLASNIANKQNKVFVDFAIEPVISQPALTLDYFENKKLYFLKWQDGVLKGVN